MFGRVLPVPGQTEFELLRSGFQDRGLADRELVVSSDWWSLWLLFCGDVLFCPSES